MPLLFVIKCRIFSIHKVWIFKEWSIVMGGDRNIVLHCDKNIKRLTILIFRSFLRL